MPQTPQQKSKTFRDRAKALGLCIECKKRPPTLGYVRCLECRFQRAEMAKIRKERI